MKSDYMTIAQAAEKWKLSQRQVQHLCTKEAAEGAIRFGKVWMIPRDAQKPIDRRTKAARVKRTVLQQCRSRFFSYYEKTKPCKTLINQGFSIKKANCHCINNDN